MPATLVFRMYPDTAKAKGSIRQHTLRQYPFANTPAKTAFLDGAEYEQSR